jgi:hypothetical protein
VKPVGEDDNSLRKGIELKDLETRMLSEKPLALRRRLQDILGGTAHDPVQLV